MSRRLVVEADGGSRGNPGPAAYGAVVRDGSSGEVLAERAEAIGETTNNVAEYRGLIAGLRAAREIDPAAHLDVRLDSKLIVEQMSGRWKIKHPAIRALALEARDLVPAGRTTFTWVPREQNRAADALVNAALDAAASGRVLGIRADEPGEGPAQLTLGEEPPTAHLPVERTPAVPGWGPDLGPATTFLLIRHGVTEHTVARRFSGSDGEDPPLSHVGQEQAAAAAREVRIRGGADVVLASPLLRTRQTAAAIASELDLEVEVLADFRETAFGEWNGLTFDEVAAGWPDQLDSWLRSPHFEPPGGESMAAMAARVTTALTRLRREHVGARVVVVTHVNPIRVVVGGLLDAPLEAVTRLEVPPASLTTLRWWPDGNRSLRGFGDVGHYPDLARRHK